MKSTITLKKGTAFFLRAVCCLLFIQLFQCERNVASTLSTENDHSAAVLISIRLEPVATLAKRQTINLKRLVLFLTSAGKDTIRDSIALSGTGGSDVKTTIGNLTAPKTWTLHAFTRDQFDSLVHTGSVDFSAVPADTVEVSLTLAARFSMLRASFNAIPDSVTKLTVSVDGAVKADSGLAAGGLDTVVMRYDYLSATQSGAVHAVSLKARGSYGGIDTLLFVAETTLTVKSGEDKVHAITMKWVGPKINRPPVFSSKPSDYGDTAIVGILYIDTVHATDPDNDPITYAYIENGTGTVKQLPDSTLIWTPTLADTGPYKIVILAIDNKGASDTLSKMITISLGPHTVARPATPSGPQNGSPGTKYGFVTTPLLCSHYDSLQYRFSWGNGTFGAWRKSFTDSVTWPDYGIYKVQVQARCSMDTTIVSDTSQGFLVGVLNGPDGTLFDDCDGDGTGMNRNRFGGGWWGVDDTSGSNCNGKRSIILNRVNNELKFTANEGNPFGSGESCLKLVYALDSLSNCDTSTNDYNGIAIGNNFRSDGSGRDLTGLTKIVFWAKAIEPTDIHLRLGTTDIPPNSAGSNYQFTATINTSWQKYEVLVDSLKQPSWANPIVPLRLDRASAVEFEFSDNAPNPKNGTLWIDDIYLQGYSWKP